MKVKPVIELQKKGLVHFSSLTISCSENHPSSTVSSTSCFLLTRILSWLVKSSSSGHRWLAICCMLSNPLIVGMCEWRISPNKKIFKLYESTYTSWFESKLNFSLKQLIYNQWSSSKLTLHIRSATAFLFPFAHASLTIWGASLSFLLLFEFTHRISFAFAARRSCICREVKTNVLHDFGNSTWFFKIQISVHKKRVQLLCRTSKFKDITSSPSTAFRVWLGSFGARGFLAFGRSAGVGGAVGGNVGSASEFGSSCSGALQSTSRVEAARTGVATGGTEGAVFLACHHMHLEPWYAQ